MRTGYWIGVICGFLTATMIYAASPHLLNWIHIFLDGRLMNGTGA